MAARIIPFLAAAAIAVTAPHAASAQYMPMPYHPIPVVPVPNALPYQPVPVQPYQPPPPPFWQQQPEPPRPVVVVPFNAFGSTIR